MKKLSVVLVFVVLFSLLAGAAFAGKLEDIKSKGVLVAGVKDSQPPFGYVDENSKQIVGFEIDICKFLADKLGAKLELKPVTSATRIPMLTQGSVDIVAGTMTHKIEREAEIDFSITYFPAEQKLLVKKGGGVNTVADLAGKKVGSAKGSTSEKNIQKAQPKCQVISFDTYPMAFLALKQGKVDAVTTDAPILAGLKANDDKPEMWEITGDFIADEPYGLGLPENDSDFRDFVNASLMEMWRSGEYAKIYDKWFGPKSKCPLELKWKMELWP